MTTPGAPRSVAGLAAAMTIAMGVGPLIVYAISTLSPFLIPDMGLTRTQYGALAAATYISAGVSSVWAGRVTDRAGVRPVMWWLTLGCVGAIFAAAWAPSYGFLLGAVVVSGLVQALSNPVTNRLAVHWLPPSSRGVVMGVKQSGVQMTQAAAGLFLPALAVTIGWRGSMATIAAVCLAIGVALVALFVPRDGGVGEASTDTVRVPLPASVWWLTGFMFLTGLGLQGVNFYLPLFGYEQLGMSAERAGLLAAIIGVMGIAARIAWGRVADRIGGGSALRIVAIGAALALTLIFLSDFGVASLVWFGAVLLGATGVAANVVVMVTVLRSVPQRTIGRATGVVATGMYVGFMTGPLGVGVIVDATGSYAWAWVVVGIAYVLAVLSSLGFARSVRRGVLRQAGPQPQ